MSDRLKHDLILALAAIAAFAIVLSVAWIDQKYFAPHMKAAIEFQERLKHHIK